MKKYIIFAATALAVMAACTRVESFDTKKEINFQVANRIQTKADGSVYNNGAFGTYSWFTAESGSSHADFMVNEEVDLIGGVWKTKNHTFYWPKTGSIDFISYSPFNGTNNSANSNPAVTETTISYTGITADVVDYMYADKATCSSNVNQITDDDTADSGYSGVPTLFRHALAKLSFKVQANFVEWDDANNSSHTEWKVTINSFKIGGFKTTGDCALTLDTDAKSWVKPQTNIGTDADPVYVNVWTNLSGTTADQELVDATTYPAGVVLTEDPQDLTPAAGFVMPQVLTAGIQTIDIDAKIKTTLSNGNIIEEDFVKTINISDISTLKAWQMNQNIVYTIKFKPTAKVDLDDSPEDVIIHFDPAVADWTTINVGAVIQL